jgi:small conductance mechanosensitive channel
MGERTGLTDRLKLVLDKLEAKGGDGKPYRLYIASIGGIKIDVSDRTATLARISGWLTSEEGGLRLAREVGTFLAYIIGSILVARIVRMILRRVMSGDHVTSHLLRDFIISSTGRVIIAIGFLLALSALEVNLAPLLAVIGAAGFVVAFAFAGYAQQFRQRPPHHGVQAVRRRRQRRSPRRHQGQGHACDHLQHLHSHR